MELDDAYANAAYIPEGDSFPTKWETDAVVFRDMTEGAELDLAYGPAARQKLLVPFGGGCFGARLGCGDAELYALPRDVYRGDHP